MIFEDYFYEVWNEMPDSIITEEYYNKNEALFEAITYDFFYYNEQTNNLPSHVARFVIQQIVNNSLVLGIR